MTEEQKKLEENLKFGTKVYDLTNNSANSQKPAKTSQGGKKSQGSTQARIATTAGGIGFGLNSLKDQQELIELRNKRMLKNNTKK